MRLKIILLVATAFARSAVAAETQDIIPRKPPDAFAPIADATLTTGDSWIVQDRQYRLFGVQACIMGETALTIRNERLDCGAASRAALAAFFKSGDIACRRVDSRPKVDYLTCNLTIAGKTTDLGAALIASGYAFAAVQPNPKDNRSLAPIHPPYALLEASAQAARAGLWANKHLPHPTRALANAYYRTR